MSVSNKYIVISIVNCSILEFGYRHCMRLIYKSTLTNVDNFNLNVHVQDQHLTIHELSDDEIESMIHDIATNLTYSVYNICGCIFKL